MRQGFWRAVLLVAIVTPLVAYYMTSVPRGLFPELITISGILATSFLASAVIVPSRLKSITRAFGLETVYASHRYLSLCAAAMALAHVAIVLVADPANVALLNPVDSPNRAFAGAVAMLAMGVLVAFAVQRVRIKLAYDTWRWVHVGLAVAVLVGVTVHILLIRKLVTSLATAAPLGFLLAAVLLIAAWRWIGRPLDRRSHYTVERVHDASPTVSTLSLSPVAGRHSRFRFLPGQFAWLRLRRSPTAAEHPFTISSAAQDSAHPEFTIRRSGEWTDEVPNLRTGDDVYIDGPHGGMVADGGAEGIVLIASGVGAAPMLSILRSFAQDNDPRPLHIFLADRPGETLFRAELDRLGTVLTLERTETFGARITAPLLSA